MKIRDFKDYKIEYEVETIENDKNKNHYMEYKSIKFKDKNFNIKDLIYYNMTSNSFLTYLNKCLNTNFNLDTDINDINIVIGDNNLKEYLMKFANNIELYINFCINDSHNIVAYSYNNKVEINSIPNDNNNVSNNNFDKDYEEENYNINRKYKLITEIKLYIS